MQKQGRFVAGSLLILVCVLLVLTTGRASYQSYNPASGVSPFAGTWNLIGTAQTNPASPFLAVMSFQFGGTTAEFDTSGTNSSASPGESPTLGKWNQTGLKTAEFSQENFIYDQNANISQLAVENVTVTLDSPQQTEITGKGEISFYSCSVTQCPGPLLFGPIALEFTGTRF